ncbi:hypothetical protein SAMN02910377_01608 [Pseudobutyrivibrio ruminis]|jgi:hypothetical protein|uniref:Flagellar protein FlgJ N-terminal domain-containing protein n=1 Tax=Pseudobutyrivibrio ruminis TaxID=46206 RepID=A0A1H7J9B2_9FIRM|nr:MULTISPECIES: hypothetical protein [Pseudobutyrivibrio]SEK71218.1 hypothetical protein SAMN02910377_01608 [Pseudobutyrivibrio ruminis]SET12177.1 hypothetical protein SAMN02910413_1842 [Pseudobutyrivibrio sp. C4]
MDLTSMNTYLQSQYTNQAKAAAETTAKSIGNISQNSSREEIEEAVKSFETYMMEQVVKQVKESFVNEDEENKDTNMSMYKDLYMDKAITEVASQLVDQIGGDVTDDFVEQIMRNYGITGTTGAQTESAGVDAATVSEDIAQTNASKVTEVLA